MTKQQKMLPQAEQVDPLWDKPLEMGIEAIIGTIEDKDELKEAVHQYLRRKRRGLSGFNL